MEYFLIKGHFHVVGYSPDGDSLMFEANDPKMWDKVLTEHREIFTEKLEAGKGSVQLRLQGLDALETHYGPTPVPPPKDMAGKTFAKAEKPKAGNYKQPETFGELATEKLLSYLGVASTEWGSKFGAKWVKSVTVKASKVTYDKKNEDKLEGYVIVNDMDMKGRPLSWVFGGTTSTADGSNLSTTEVAAKIKTSGNYKLIATGMVYPYFFMTLAAKLRQKLIDGYKNAKRQKMGVWSVDKTLEGIELDKRSQLTDEYLIFPYLFRRIIKHQFQRQNDAYYEAVKAKKAFQASETDIFLSSFFDDTNPYVFLIAERDFVRLDAIVEVSKTNFKLLTDPGNIVFLS
ncbi:MAG: hypothetical protein R2828_35255 [Saprospiraceae bacterium]